MRTEHVLALWQGELRKFVVLEARRHSRNEEDVKDYIQEAWLAISRLGDSPTTPAGADMCWHDKDDYFYKQIVHRAIQSAYRRNLRYRERVRPFTKVEMRSGQVDPALLSVPQREDVGRRLRFRRRIPRQASRGASVCSSGGPRGRAR